MKSSMLVAVLLGLLVVVASAHGHGKGGPHGGHHGGRPGHHEAHKGDAAEKPAFCSYKSTKGHTFDFSHLASKDLLVKDMLGGSTYHFNPCGSVHAKECPSGSAVCEITSKGAAISHGLASNAHWADGVESGATVEVTYGGGELCAEGEHRKTAVEMRCLPSANSKEGASFLMGVIKEDCLLKLIVESPLACDMEAVCSAIKTEDACNGNSDVCDWKHGLCVAAEKHHGMFGSRKEIVTFVISAFIGFTVVVSLCCVATCACIACRRVVRKRQLRRSLPTYKKAKKTSKKAGKKVAAEELNLITPETFENAIPENHYPFQAYAMQQAADGSFVPVPVHMPMPPHAYSYPMVMQATYHVQQQ